MIGGFGQTHSPNTMSAILRNRAVKQALSGAYAGYARGFASVPDVMVSTAAPMPTRAELGGVSADDDDDVLVVWGVTGWTLRLAHQPMISSWVSAFGA